MMRVSALLTFIFLCLICGIKDDILCFIIIIINPFQIGRSGKNITVLEGEDLEAIITNAAANDIIFLSDGTHYILINLFIIYLLICCFIARI